MGSGPFGQDDAGAGVAQGVGHLETFSKKKGSSVPATKYVR